MGSSYPPFLSTNYFILRMLFCEALFMFSSIIHYLILCDSCIDSLLCHPQSLSVYLYCLPQSDFPHDLTYYPKDHCSPSPRKAIALFFTKQFHQRRRRSFRNHFSYDAHFAKMKKTSEIGRGEREKGGGVGGGEGKARSREGETRWEKLTKKRR